MSHCQQKRQQGVVTVLILVVAGLACVVIGDGSYDLPYSNIPSALGVTPPGGTIVLNGRASGLPPPNYPAQTITNAVTLTAFPDRPVTNWQLNQTYRKIE